MILATIGSNYSLETNSLAVRRRKYLLNYLAVPVLAVSAALLVKRGGTACTQLPSRVKCASAIRHCENHALRSGSYV